MTTRFRPAVATLLALAALVTGAAADVGSPRGGPRIGRLEVAGGSLAGQLAAADETAAGTRDTLLWRSPRFATPLEFRIGEIAGITFPASERAAEPTGPVVQLRGGDALPAVLESLDADALVLSTAGAHGPQRLRIARDEVAAIVRSGGGAGSFRGPDGLMGWEQTPAGSWREQAGRILTDRAGAAVTRDVSAPLRARYTIRLSRRRAAEFRVVVAAGERPADDGYVLQAVGVDGANALMLVRRAGGRAAIEPLPEAPWRDDTLDVVLFVDQERGRLAAILPDAADAEERTAIEVTLPVPTPARPSGRVRLELTTGQICLERLEVTPWRGEAPTLRDVTETTILTKTGALAGFTVTSFAAADGEYVLSRDGETKRVPAADVEEIRFPDGDEAAAEPALRVARTDGGAISGDLVKVDDQAIWLRRRGIDGAVAVPHDAILTLLSQRPAPAPEEPAGRVGTLVAGDDRARGWLVEAADGGLAWRPLGSATAAAFAGDTIDAEVEFLPRPPGMKKGDDTQVGGIGGIVSSDNEGFFIVVALTDDGAAARDGRMLAGDRIIAVAPTERSQFVDTKGLDNETVTNLLRGRVGTTVRIKVTDGAGANPRVVDLARGPISAAGREVLEAALQVHLRLGRAPEPEDDPRAEYPALVVLRSGDVAPCRIEAVDADAVLLRTPQAGGVDAGPVRVPATLVKAVELIPSAGRREIDKTLRDRLLTLPRMQRDRPPMHLLRLVDGDYLRGRLVAVDDATVTFEVLDVVKRLPRQQVARLIWLHPELPGDAGAEATQTAVEPEGLVVQGVAADGRRFTLVAEGVEGNELRGRSQAFGDSAIDLARVDRVLIGAAIGRDLDDLPFSQWVLRPAPEPRALGKPAGE
jgi:hypothetical protein